MRAPPPVADGGDAAPARRIILKNRNRNLPVRQENVGFLFSAAPLDRRRARPRRLGRFIRAAKDIAEHGRFDAFANLPTMGNIAAAFEKKCGRQNSTRRVTRRQP
jgi:hypothetical protein